MNCAENYTKIQSDENSRCRWVDKNKLIFSASKWIISRLRRNVVLAYDPTLYGNPMERVSVYKYLGVIITDNPSWSAHIDDISNKAKKIIGLIYCQFYAWSPPAALHFISVIPFRVCNTSLEYALS